MKDQNDGNNAPEKLSDKELEEKFPGYPVYAPEDDIYAHGHKDRIDGQPDGRPVEPGKNNEKDFEEDISGDDLDVPGTDLDDDMEDVGSEDEENNYYSLSDNQDEEEAE